MLSVFHANDTHDSRGSRWHTRCAGRGKRDLPGRRNVAGPPALSAPWTPRASQREADAHPPNRRRHTERGLRIRHGRVLPELDAGASGSAQFTRAVSYDRAGHGWSDPAREPRTARQIAEELHTLL